MIKLRNIVFILVVFLLIGAGSSDVFAFAFSSPPEKTGAPGEGNCTLCHTSNTLNATGGSLVLTIPENYTPGEVYDIVVQLSRAGQSRWGFQMTSLNSNNVRAGTFSSIDGNTQAREKNSKQYIEHTTTGTAAGKQDTNSWTFKWTAPLTDVGPITFYTAGNAANGNFVATGDYIYTQKATSEVPRVYGVTLSSSDLTKETADANTGVTYTLTVTNTGNTEDTIQLGSDAEAGIGGSVLGSFRSNNQTIPTSRLDITLGPEESMDVTFITKGDLLTKAGSYPIKVTATSQADSTKTAEITTTTTILPVYGVSLVGVGDLTTETSDASDGVSYTISVSNNGNTYDLINLSTDNISATLSQSSLGLDPGSSQNVTLTIPGTTLATAGQYEVKVTATSQGDNTQTAEITTSTTILPVYGVSLVGVGDLTTETSDASDGVSYTLTVTNNGNTDDTIDLTTSDDGELSQESVTLAAGASEEVTLTISGATLATAGQYEVKVTATSQGDSTQTAEITTSTTILPVYDVSLVGVGELRTETDDASDGVSYTFTLTNDGNTEDTIELATSGIAATLSETSVSLASGASVDVILSISGEVLATAGDYEVIVSATSQGDTTKTAVATTTTTILSVYGVSLIGVGEMMTETDDASDGVSYKFTVTNNGNTEDTIDIATSGTEATLSETSVSLASGASAEITLTISGEVLATAGDYEVIVSATSQGDTTKTAVATTTTTILSVYGVSLTGVGDLTRETDDASDGVSYKFTVTNNGNTDDTIDLTTSDDGELSQESVTLAAGASEEVSLMISGTTLATAGDYEVKVTATSQGDSTQTAEITTSTTILSVYSVSLVGVGEMMTETDDASDGVSYKFTVTNNGNTEDTIDIATSGTEATLSETSVSLASGASAEITLTISGTALATAGDYEVTVTATSQGDSTQTAEITTSTTILPVYDVSMVGVGELITETMDASEGVNYTVTVTNNGNTEDMVDLTTTGTAATLSETSVSLASGASVDVILSISGEVLATAGDYEVKITATSQGDSTQTTEITTTTTILPVYGVMVETVNNIDSKTVEPGEDVSYVFTVTNTGNTEDTINLTSSNDGTTLSVASVTLASGASEEITLEISGDTLKTDGDYEVTVTATSQADDTGVSEITTTTTVSTVAVYGIMLAGLDDIITKTSDPGKDVVYSISITNTGNTEDMIDLSTSDESATLSNTTVTLAAGAAEQVTLTVPGETLITAGDYEVIVTASSQSDDTVTSEITLTTTVIYIYGVMIEGELQGGTMDMLQGVSYTLTITNTGNVEDTYVLSSSAEVGIEGSVLGSFATSSEQETPTSQLKVTLAAGDSTEVIFTAAGDFFTKLGIYEITVTATSQGDNTKTAEVTTVTTIEPVPWDLNGDGTVNILDLVAVANQFGESGEGLAGDVNGDGNVNILDLVQVASYFGKSHVEIVQANQ